MAARVPRREKESVYGVRMRRVFGIFEGAVLKIEGNMYSGEVRDFYCNFYYLLYLKKSDEHKVEPNKTFEIGYVLSK